MITSSEPDVGSMLCATKTTIGIKIPNVPHAVPVENDKKPAIAKITAARIAPTKEI